MNNTKLELTWYGKDNKISPEPRILLENKELSYGDRTSENLLIHGDNLLALKALEQKYAGKVKCIYIDPPYNTGSAFKHYDDNLEHSTWLNLMKPRIELLKRLLSVDGSLWISIDDDEQAYLKVLCDEVFGRNNFINNIIWQKKYSPQNDAKWFSDSHDFIMVYAKNKQVWRPNLLPRTEKMNDRYKNLDNDPRGPWKTSDLSVRRVTPKDIYEIKTPSGRAVLPPEGRSWGVSQENFNKLVLDKRIWFGKEGTSIPQLKRFLSDVKDGMTALSIWLYTEVGHNQDAKKEIKALNCDTVFETPKPEKLLKRILALGSNPGDIVLDSFLGSGTTTAVAHKMGRRWIGIELGDHAYTHCKLRMDKVINGSDQGGISKSVDWKGGGGYKFLELADSLVAKDEFGQAVISDKYNADMLAAAMCLHKGYGYAPSKDVFWKQGARGGKNFIFSTTEYLMGAMLDAIAIELDCDEHCLICATAMEDGLDKKYKNISVQKIPQAILDRCQYGANNYNLNVVTAEDFEEEYDED